MSEFDEYIVHGEPGQKEKADAWQTVIGLQDVKTDSPKSQIDTLDCTLEELAVLKVIGANPKITQTEIAKSIKKSASTVKRITSTLVEKGIIIRRNGRRNG